MRRLGLGILGGILVVVTALPSHLLEARENGAPMPPALVPAERQAEAGDLKGALDTLLAAEPRISNVNAGTSPSKDWALRVAARIVARTEKPPFEGFPSDEEQTKWAYLQVRKLKEADPNPALLTDFAEIASRIPTERAEAQKVLEDLDGRSEMASSFGYATLARLRDEVGRDSAAVAGAPLRALAAGKRQVALTRCRKMAKTPTTCDKGIVAIPSKG